MAISHDLEHHPTNNTTYQQLPEELQEAAVLALLANPLLLCHTIDYLPVSATLNLAATSRTVRHYVYNTPSVFRRLDLSRVKSAQFDIDPIDHGGQTWRNVQLDEHVTEDECVLFPLYLLQQHTNTNTTRLVSMLGPFEASSRHCAGAISCATCPR